MLDTGGKAAAPSPGWSLLSNAGRLWLFLRYGFFSRGPGPRKIASVGFPNAYGVVDSIAQAVRQDRVIYETMPTVSLRDWEVLVRW